MGKLMKVGLIKTFGGGKGIGRRGRIAGRTRGKVVGSRGGAAGRLRDGKRAQKGRRMGRIADSNQRMQSTAQPNQQSSEVQQQQELQQSSTSLPHAPPSQQRSTRKSSVRPPGKRLVSGAIIGRFRARWWPPIPADQETTEEVDYVEDGNTEDNENGQSGEEE